jgi:hypothetical protein
MSFRPVKRLGDWLFRRRLQRRIAAARRLHPLEPIVDTRPVPCDRESPIKIWMLVCERDALMALWSAKSLAHYAQRPFDLSLADDGSIGPTARQLFEHHLPEHRFVAYRQSTALCERRLADFPLSLALRLDRKNPLPIKLFDALFWVPAERFLLLDSDVFFFRRPERLLALLAEPPGTNYFNREQSWLNSGLAIIDKASLQLAAIEERLAELPPELRSRWGIEQRLYTELSKGYGAEALPGEYSVTPLRRRLPRETLVSVHYIGLCRDLLYSDGVRRLEDAGLLRRLAPETGVP